MTASAAAIMDAAQRLWSHLAERGTECVDEFDSGDAQAMFVSKGLWHLSTVLPLLWYLAGMVDKTPRFPATISWTVRKGSGSVLFHAFWVAGWLNFLRPLLRHEACRGAVPLGASLQMWATGIVAISLSPVGVSDAVDTRHHVTSAKYMVDHIAMCAIFGVGGLYARGMIASGLVFGVSTFYLKAVKRKHGEDTIPSGASCDYRIAQRKKLSAAARREIAGVELVEMVTEYAIFSFFISGMPTWR